MKALTPPTRSRYHVRHLLPVFRLLISLFITLLCGILLFSNAVISSVISAIIDIGLDPLRAQLIAALFMTTGAAILGAALGRHKLGAILGGGIIFWVSYLANFIQLELQPVRDPGGNLEPLVVGALVHTSFVLAALALLSAFIGAALGIALAEVLLDPLLRLVLFAWQHFTHNQYNTAFLYQKERAISSRGTIGTIGSWLGAAIFISLLVLASASSDLFIFSPDIGLHSLPNITHITKGHKQEVHGTILEDSLLSRALNGQRKPFMIYLPPSYNTPAGQSRRYPTLYLLHGSPGSDHDWFSGGKADQAADTLIALGKIPELILILPDGNGRPGATTEWGNSFDQRQLIETYVANDLVQYVDANYRTLAQPTFRAIGGLSMGGFGATNIALHHPEIFGTVISLGGYYQAEGSIWGNSATYRQTNSPAEVILSDKPAWRLRFYLGAATRDQPYYNDTIQFAQELKTLHIQYHFDLQNGYHSWVIWQVQIYNALSWLQWS